MTHVFVAPHPDDVALSCGGLIASLRELGQTVTILTVFSGDGQDGHLTAVPARGARLRLEGDVAGDRGVQPQRHRRRLADRRARSRVGRDEDRLDATQADADAASKRFWQRSSWYRRASIRNESLAEQVVMDDVSTQGAFYTDDVIDAAAAGDLMARRRIEDERFAYFSEASIVFLDLPDAVFRGYEGDDELLGMPRDDDDAPFELLRQEIARLEPQKVYLPLGVGGHVDHQLCREVGVRLLQEGRRWVMPGPDYAGSSRSTRTSRTPGGTTSGASTTCPGDPLAALPSDVSVIAEFADVTDQLEKKIMGVSLYESQIERLFDGTRQMADAVRSYGRAMAELGDVDGSAERYWVSGRV